MKGRKPKPTILKIAENAEKRRINAQEPKFPPGMPEPPPDFMPAAMEAWEYYGKLLSQSGVMSKEQRDNLAELAEAIAVKRQCLAEMQECGLFFTDANGIERQRPATVLYRQMSVLVLKRLESLGLTPTSKSKVHVADRPKSDLLAFINRKKG